MTQSSRKKVAISSLFNKIAYPSQFFAGDWITRRAKINEHKIVANLLSREKIEQGARALDVGCGAGGYFDILLAKGFHVVGFDIAENMVKVCRAKYGEGNNVELMMADVEYLPFVLDSFHLVLCIDTLQYMDEESRGFVLKELVKLIKPGNPMIVEVKNKYCPAFWFHKWHYKRTLQEHYSITSVASVLKNSGCTIEAIKGVFWPAFLSPVVVVKARRSYA